MPQGQARPHAFVKDVFVQFGRKIGFGLMTEVVDRMQLLYVFFSLYGSGSW